MIVTRCEDCGHGAYRHAPADKDRSDVRPPGRADHPERGCSVPGCRCTRTVVT